jgi:hypothetical protein
MWLEGRQTLEMAYFFVKSVIIRYIAIKGEKLRCEL